MSDNQGLYVRFALEARKDEAASAEKGEPVWKNVEYIELHVPGDKTNVPYRPVTPADKERFARQYEAWKRGQEEVHDGQPLKTWAAVTPAEVNMLAHGHVYTVEQLAAVSDENASRIGPILALRDKARKHLENARVQAPVDKLTAQLEEQRKRIEFLSERLEQATSLLQRAPEQKPPEQVELVPEEAARTHKQKGR